MTGHLTVPEPSHRLYSALPDRRIGATLASDAERRVGWELLGVRPADLTPTPPQPTVPRKALNAKPGRSTKLRYGPALLLPATATTNDRLARQPPDCNLTLSRNAYPDIFTEQ
jgi:hypothetical protein